MTIVNPEPTKTSKVAPKVAWATAGSYLVGVVALALINGLTANDNALLIDVMPDALEAFLLPSVPAIAAFLAGYSAKHQWRVKPGGAGSTPVG